MWVAAVSTWQAIGTFNVQAAVARMGLGAVGLGSQELCEELRLALFIACYVPCSLRLNVDNWTGSVLS